MSSGGGFLSLWCLRFCLGPCEADFWKLRVQLFPVPRGCVCVCMLNFWFSRYDTICADNYIYFRFCRHVSQCEVGVVSVRRHDHQGGPWYRGVLPRGVPPFRLSPNLATSHTPSMVCACLCAWHGNEHALAVPVSSGKWCCSWRDGMR